RAQRGLLEDEPDRAAGEEALLLALPLRGLQRVGEVERGLQLRTVPVGDAREVAALQLFRDGNHRLGDASRRGRLVVRARSRGRRTRRLQAGLADAGAPRTCGS